MEMEKSYGEMVAAVRSRRGMSQTEVAEMMGVSRNYLSQIERGEADNLSLNIAAKIVWILGVRHPLMDVEVIPMVTCPTCWGKGIVQQGHAPDAVRHTTQAEVPDEGTT